MHGNGLFYHRYLFLWIFTQYINVVIDKIKLDISSHETRAKLKPIFYQTNLFARYGAKTEIQECDYLAKKKALTNHVAEFCVGFSSRGQVRLVDLKPA